ncbi:protein ALP1-like [Lotus japonicus]|uniref:protein ALP1-like n=1 Tax=Lotus japonicus TaxID=34305 RepID=UPI002582782C|nr:protein ALP1-like [Lotus japonicus]
MASAARAGEGTSAAVGGAGSGSWWDDYSETKFKQTFRMRRSTFNLICDMLKSELKDPEKKVAICLLRVATRENFANLAVKFGSSPESCRKRCVAVCDAIWKVMLPMYLSWPDIVDLTKNTADFHLISGIPHVVGSMHTIHVPLNMNAHRSNPSTSLAPAEVFLNRPSSKNIFTAHSTLLQGVVNPQGLFIDFAAGSPGSMSDDDVLVRSKLYEMVNTGIRDLRGMWIVGTSGCPLLDWLLTPYPRPRTLPQHTLNDKIFKIQEVAKEAFSRLKGRWSILQLIDVKPKELYLTLGVCCVLHNICEMNGDEIDPSLKFHLMDDELLPQIADLTSKSAKKARDKIAEYLASCT